MVKKIPMPSDSGRGPMDSTGTPTPMAPAVKLKAVAKGEPTRGSGSDTSPYSSARRGSKPRS